jgi:hypothetical protein
MSCATDLPESLQQQIATAQIIGNSPTDLPRVLGFRLSATLPRPTEAEVWEIRPGAS